MKKGSKKQRTIAAIVELIHAQNNGTWVSACANCPLCALHWDAGDSCAGCPSANHSGSCGCCNWYSYRYGRENNGFDSRHNVMYFNHRRARFWLHNLPYILAQPDSMFTKKGWKYFELEEVD